MGALCLLANAALSPKPESPEEDREQLLLNPSGYKHYYRRSVPFHGEEADDETMGEWDTVDKGRLREQQPVLNLPDYYNHYQPSAEDYYEAYKQWLVADEGKQPKLVHILTPPAGIHIYH